MTHIRDDAFAKLGSATPTFSITSSDRLHDRPDNASTARLVQGTFQVPNYLSGDGGPGSTFNLGPDGLPVQSTTNPMWTANFECTIPRAVITRRHAQLGEHLPGPRHALRPRAARQTPTRSPTRSSRTWATSTTSSSVAPTGSGLSEDDVLTDAGILPGRLEVPDAARPRSAGDARLPLPRPSHGRRRAGSTPTPRSRARAARG